MAENEFTEDELFVYTNGDRWELGMVKRPNNTGDGYFCWYSTGDTAANTPTDHMHKLANNGFTKIEGLLSEATSECERLFQANVEKNGEILRLLEENAKLRGVVKDMFAHESTDCERCAYGERCKAHETTCYTAGIIIRKRAHELGVDDV